MKTSEIKHFIYLNLDLLFAKLDAINQNLEKLEVKKEKNREESD